MKDYKDRRLWRQDTHNTYYELPGPYCDYGENEGISLESLVRVCEKSISEAEEGGLENCCLVFESVFPSYKSPIVFVRGYRSLTQKEKDLQKFYDGVSKLQEEGMDYHKAWNKMKDTMDID